MFKRKLIITSVAAMAVSGAAWAQQAGPESPAAPPAAQAQGETQIAIQPQDIDNFAKAALTFREIEQDGAMDASQKQAAKLAAVQDNDLDPMKFNAIAEASKTNPELQQRVQAAVVKEQEKRAGQAGR